VAKKRAARRAPRADPQQELRERMENLEADSDTEDRRYGELHERVRHLERANSDVWKAVSVHVKNLEQKLNHLHNRLQNHELRTIGSRPQTFTDQCVVIQRQRLLIDRYQKAFHILGGTLDGVRLRDDDGSDEAATGQGQGIREHDLCSPVSGTGGEEDRGGG